MNVCPWCGSPSNHEYIQLKDYFLSQEPFSVFECPSCHLLYTVPRPSSEKLGEYYKSENYYSHQENKHGLIPRIYESVKTVNLRRKVRLATEGLSPGSVLDIGCGVGDFLATMADQQWHIVGIEPDLDACAIAEKRLGVKPLSPHQYSSLPDHSMDLITLWHVLEHVEDLHFQFDELNRLLKPGGRLLIALPNYTSYDAQYYGQFWAAWDVPRHLYHFNPDALRKIASSCSFEITDIQKLTWDAYYISYLSEGYQHHPLPLLRGFFVGLFSNLKACSTHSYSSLVYRLVKR